MSISAAVIRHVNEGHMNISWRGASTGWSEHECGRGSRGDRHVHGESSRAIPQPLSIVPVMGALRAPITSTVSRTLDSLIRRGVRRVVLDLSDLNYIDAMGVGELVCAFRAMNTAGGRLRIAYANERVRRMLHTAGLFTLLAGDADAWGKIAD
jgi:anti-sigma B factor antagonist